MTNKKTVDDMESLYKEGAIVNLGANPRHVRKVNTGRPSIDYVTDGGIPRGRLVLIAGKPSAGKSSLTLQIAASIAEKVLYIDTEATLTTDYIEALGADPSKFYHCIPESTEQLVNIIRKEIKNFENGCIVIDSINNSASEEQIQKNAEDRTMANRAIVLAAQLPIIISLTNQYNVTIFVLSQIRDNFKKANIYSPDTIIPGGNSLHHNSSMTIEMSPAEKKKDKDKDDLGLYERIWGRMIKIHVSKNKVGIPLRTVEVEFTYGSGFTIEADVASAAVRLGIVEKAGSWLKYEGKSICQGTDNLRGVLQDNPELLEELIVKINKTEIQDENNI